MALTFSITCKQGQQFCGPLYSPTDQCACGSAPQYLSYWQHLYSWSPRNGRLASGQIEALFFFFLMATFQIHFKARCPQASTIRDFEHLWRVIEAEGCCRNCCINSCPMDCILCWIPIVLKLKAVAELKYYLFVGKGKIHRKPWTSF